MADKAKIYGSVKRFGVRYGTKLKGKIAKIEAERKLSTKCPYCHYNKAKRMAAGIWYCSKCKNKFTGKAYSIGGSTKIKEEAKTAAQPEEAKESIEAYEDAEEAESLNAAESESEEQEA